MLFSIFVTSTVFSFAVSTVFAVTGAAKLAILIIDVTIAVANKIHSVFYFFLLFIFCDFIVQRTFKKNNALFWEKYGQNS